MTNLISYIISCKEPAADRRASKNVLGKPLFSRKWVTHLDRYSATLNTSISHISVSKKICLAKLQLPVLFLNKVLLCQSKKVCC